MHRRIKFLRLLILTIALSLACISLPLSQTSTARSSQATVFTPSLASLLTPLQASEHLVMGNPSNATANPRQSANFLMIKPQYVLSYNRAKGTPNWVSWHLDSSWVGDADRSNDFRPDPSLPSRYFHVRPSDYNASGFDRGHVCPSADRTNTAENNSATFLMTNMMPQAPDNNQGVWRMLEEFERELVAEGNEVYIVAGPQGIGGTGSNGRMRTLSNGRITVPARTWKVLLVLPEEDGDDVSRVTRETRTIAVIIPNRQGVRNDDWRDHRVSVDAVEALTGFDFFSNVRRPIQRAIEARVDDQ